MGSQRVTKELKRMEESRCARATTTKRAGGTNMKTTLRYLSLNAQATWHRQVEEQLKRLHGLTAITAAEVVLEHQREARPAFRVQVRLEVPGPGMQIGRAHV